VPEVTCRPSEAALDLMPATRLPRVKDEDGDAIEHAGARHA